jgi:hypothetical protein
MGKMTGLRFGRKGIFFTFIAVMIISVFIIIYTPPADVSVRKDMHAVDSRIELLNTYINDLETFYFETVAKATAHKTIFSLILYMNSTGSFIADIDRSYEEVFINGTINGVSIDSFTGAKIMENSSLSNWTKLIIDTASDTFNANTSIKINKITANQSRPWNLDSTIIMDLHVDSDVASWDKKNVSITVTNSIEGFPDPYYLVNTNGAYHNNIISSGVVFNKWNISQVREHLRNGTYVYWQNSDAPSFLMRFSNDMGNSSCCGIESLVDPGRVTPSDRIESYVDYLFWTGRFSDKCNFLYNITNPPIQIGLWDEFRYFKLDLIHVSKYNITGEYVKITC